MLKYRGFTVVELLVVIVVIGILAGIGVVTFNGTQQRARVAQTADAAKAYYDALVIYKNRPANNNTYPATAAACLGEGYPVACNVNNVSGTNASVNASINNELKSILGTLPTPSFFTAGRSSIGVMFIPSGVRSLDRNPTAWLAYTLETNNSTDRCPYGKISRRNSSVAHLSDPNAVQSTDGSATANATCWVALP